MHRLLLYWDSFRRMSPRQRYFWVVNRWLKPIAYYVGHRNAALRAIPSPRALDSSRVAPVLARLRELAGAAPETADNVASVAFDHQHHPYLRALREDVQEALAETPDFSSLQTKWLADHVTEELCNYHRFLLVDRVLADVPNRHHHGLRLIDTWIALGGRLPAAAYDPFTCAVRLLNWAKLLSFLPAGVNPDPAVFARILASVETQLAYLATNIEYEIDGNHTLLEQYATWMWAACLQSIDAQRLAAGTRKKLANQIRRQFCDQGFHCEHSVHYHLQSTIIGLLWVRGQQILGFSVDADVHRLLYVACRHIRSLMLPDGTLSPLGDKCYSFFTAGTREDLHLCAKLARFLFSHNDPFAHAPQSGPIGSQYYLYLAPATMLVVDVGPIGEPANPGHGHADLLSFLYCCAGTPMIIDPGSGRYDKSSAAHETKRSLWHNTLSVDGHDQAFLWGTFRWAFLPRDTGWTAVEAPHGLRLTARYLGFRLAGWIRHERSFLVHDDFLEILDIVTGSGCHSLTFALILAPGWSTRVTDPHIVVGIGGLRRRICMRAATTPETTVDPITIYPEYGQPAAANRITYTFRGEFLPFTCTTTILPAA